MARLLIELTNRCNLRCRHCFDERHAGSAFLELDVLERTLSEAPKCGIDEVCFTGGEPTLHPQFQDVVRLVAQRKLPFGMVSNGIGFLRVRPVLLAQRRWLKSLTFSCDGATAATHDAIRGRGAFRSLMQAVTCCALDQMPFTFNMVVTAVNRAEIEALVELADGLGSAGVRFGFLMPTPSTAREGLDLPPEGSLDVQRRIRVVARRSRIPVLMGPGFYEPQDLFPCSPLRGEELNLDCRGNLTLCCQLSGMTGPNAGRDVVGNSAQIGLRDAVRQFAALVDDYRDVKHRRLRDGGLRKIDRFPCWYCMRQMGKTEGLREIDGHPWIDASGDPR